jgi:hypothetical protein
MGLPGACTVVPVDLPASRVPPSPAFLSAHGFINVGSSNFRKISLRGHPVATALPQCGCEISIGWSFSALWERLNRICSLIRLFEIRCQRNSPSRTAFRISVRETSSYYPEKATSGCLMKDANDTSRRI